MTETKPPAPIEVLPVTAERWGDLEQLFGKNGAYSNCWCTFWRISRSDFDRMKGEEKRSVLFSLTQENRVPGVLAYQDGVPVGWCSLGPREDFPSLERSRTLKRVDDRPVWSIVCFFVAKPFRRQGVGRALLDGAVAYAVSQGAKIIEGYPVDLNAPKLQGQKLTGFSGYMGIASLFRAAGFEEVRRASETQLIMRYTVE